MKRRDFFTLAAVAGIVPLVWRQFGRPAPNSANATLPADLTPVTIRDDAGAKLLAGDLPAWFDNARVQAHTRLGPRFAELPVYDRAGEATRALGATVLTRYVKAAGEPPMWPSAVTGGAARAASNPVKSFLGEAHGKGVRVIGYYWHTSDTAYAEANPGWVCRRPDGTAETQRGDWLDITGPYREIVLKRLLELAAQGLDGFYFDFVHVPFNGCRGTALEEEFTRTTGIRLPRRLAENNPNAQRFHRFAAQRVAETFRYWRSAVKKQYPDVVFLISVTYLPSLLFNRTAVSLAEIADAPKTEYWQAFLKRADAVFDGRDAPERPLAEHRMALGWCYVRDTANGRPFHVWAPGFADEASAHAAVAAITGFGGIATVDVEESAMLQPRSAKDRSGHAIAQSAFALGNRINPVMGGTRPVRWAATLISEAARDARAGNSREIWTDVLLPQIGAFGVFLDAGVPSGTVTDTQLARGELDGIRLLFIADESSLTSAQRTALNSFRARGGVVVAQNRAWNWAANPRAAAAAMRATLGSALDTAPTRVTAGSGKVFSGAFSPEGGSRLVVSVLNSFAWPKLDRSDPARNEGANERHDELAGLRAPAPLRDVTVTLRNGKTPRSAREAISGAALSVQRVANGFAVRLPVVEQAAFVVFEF